MSEEIIVEEDLLEDEAISDDVIGNDDAIDDNTMDNDAKDHEVVEAIENDDIKDQLLRNMEFDVTCEVAGVKLSINELSTLRVGDKLPMLSDLQQIRIRVNGVVIGYGELVQVEDAYGIKVNKMLTVSRNQVEF